MVCNYVLLFFLELKYIIECIGRMPPEKFMITRIVNAIVNVRKPGQLCTMLFEECLNRKSAQWQEIDNWYRSLYQAGIDRDHMNMLIAKLPDVAKLDLKKQLVVLHLLGDIVRFSPNATCREEAFSKITPCLMYFLSYGADLDDLKAKTKTKQQQTNAFIRIRTFRICYYIHKDMATTDPKLSQDVMAQLMVRKMEETDIDVNEFIADILAEVPDEEQEEIIQQVIVLEQVKHKIVKQVEIVREEREKLVYVEKQVAQQQMAVTTLNNELVELNDKLNKAGYENLQAMKDTIEANNKKYSDLLLHMLTTADQQERYATADNLVTLNDFIKKANQFVEEYETKLKAIDVASQQQVALAAQQQELSEELQSLELKLSKKPSTAILVHKPDTIIEMDGLLENQKEISSNLLE